MVTSAIRAIEAEAPQILGDSLPPARVKTSQPALNAYLGQTIYSQFVVEQLCGVGSTGTVYRAKQLGIGRPVALKVLHPELRSQREIVARFQREAQIASRISHPNIVHLYLAGVLPDGNLFLAMEFVTGVQLSRAMTPGGMPLERAVHVAEQVLAALGEAHRAGIVHRDLKPENVMLTRVGEDPDFIKVLDFGIAKLLDHRTVASRSGLVFGSPKYMSPEAAAGDPVDARSDIYSCGMILYEMLAGRPPFDAEKPLDLLMMQIRDAPPRLSAVRAAEPVPIAVEAVVHQAIEKKPDLRFRSAEVFVEALRSAAGMARGRRAAGAAPAIAVLADPANRMRHADPEPSVAAGACPAPAGGPQHQAVVAPASRRAPPGPGPGRQPFVVAEPESSGADDSIEIRRPRRGLRWAIALLAAAAIASGATLLAVRFAGGGGEAGRSDAEAHGEFVEPAASQATGPAASPAPAPPAAQERPESPAPVVPAGPGGHAATQPAATPAPVATAGGADAGTEPADGGVDAAPPPPAVTVGTPGPRDRPAGTVRGARADAGAAVGLRPSSGPDAAIIRVTNPKDARLW